MPKCEIFDHSDLHDFCSIKSLWEGDFEVKIKNFIKIFRGSFRSVNPYAQFGQNNVFFGKL
jgi:hypothetical protein